MIYLVSEIFLYLLLAMVAGVVTGGMLVSLRARNTLGNLDAQLVQLRRDLSRRDDLLLAADQRNGQLSAQIEALDKEMKAAPEPLGKGQDGSVFVQIADDLREQTVRQKKRLTELESELARVSREHAAARTAEETSNTLITALHAEIARLRQELQQRPTVSHQQTSALELANRELEARLVRKLSEVDRLEQALAAEERQVRELERERELQNKSLHVLHQQLELERTPRRATA